MCDVNSTTKKPISKIPKRCPYSSTSMDLTRFQNSSHAHDPSQGLSRVVMIRKMEQRIFINASKRGQEPKVETLTKETVQTLRPGNRTERKVTTSQKTDVPKSQHGSRDLLSSLPRSTSSSPELLNTIRQKCISRRSPLNTLANNRKCELEVNRFVSECLHAHNEYRSKHKVPPLVINKKLCRYAEEWAKHLVSRGILEHRQNCPYGENLFCCWFSMASLNQSVDARQVVDSWYLEIENHPFGKEPSSLKSGHFTQVIWLSSRELGIGLARSRNGQIFVVANYDPPGNFLGQFIENVPPIGGFLETDDTTGKCHLYQFLDYSDEQFIADALKCHNEYRKKHKSPPLVINHELCDVAERWAKTLAKEERFQHRPDCIYGENLLSMWSSTGVSARDVCSRWYEQGKNYNYSLEPRILKAGHFTQMIWKESKELGIGVARGKSSRIVVVANYSPAGNVIGKFLDNVLPPRN